MAYSPGSLSFLKLLMGEASRMDVRVVDIIGASTTYFLQVMEGIFAHVVDRGEFPGENPKKLAKFFSDLIVGFYHCGAAVGYWSPVPDDDELRDKIAFFLRANTVAGTRDSVLVSAGVADDQHR